MNPAKRQARLDEARQAFNAGDAESAERIAQSLLRLQRADTQALHILAAVASSRADDAAAVAHLQRCTTLDPRHADFHNDLARVHALAGRYGPALESLRRALALRPGQARALTDLADILERDGQYEPASAALAPLLEREALDDDVVLIQMRLLDHAGQTADAVALGRSRLPQPAGNPTVRRLLLQQLGRLQEKTGDVDAAFAAFAQAKQGESQRFDPAAHRREIDALIQMFSGPSLARLAQSSRAAGSDGRSQVPIFIACMPRSGSTLVEQVIHAHPQAHGAGEHAGLHRVAAGLPARLGVALPYPHCLSALDTTTADATATELLQALAALAPSAERVSTKHLLTYLHLGLVSLLFPGARVVHLRRDPLDNGLACYMTSLSTQVMPWATELRHIGLALREHDRLMAHWRQTLDLRLLDLQYEDLVADPEGQFRRLIDFCGLPWDERCLRFWEAERVVLTPSYDQVRRPVFNTAVGRWRRFAHHLAPLREALQA
jgi:Flp pilus assembly protein TadD